MREEGRRPRARAFKGRLALAVFDQGRMQMEVLVMIVGFVDDDVALVAVVIGGGR